MTDMMMMTGRHAMASWIAASRPGLPDPLTLLRSASGGVFLGRGRLVDVPRLAWIEMVHDGDPDAPDWVSDVSLWSIHLKPGVPKRHEDFDAFMRLALHPKNERTMILQGHFLK